MARRVLHVPVVLQEELEEGARLRSLEHLRARGVEPVRRKTPPSVQRFLPTVRTGTV